MIIEQEVEDLSLKWYLAHLVEQLLQFIFWKNTQSVYQGCNKRYAGLVGLTEPQDIIGKTDYDLHWQETGDSADFFRARDKAALEGQAVVNL